MRMDNHEAKRIQEALNDCLRGLQDRPSIQQRVFERIDGKRHSPRKITFAMAMALFCVFLVATAFAIGAFTGLFSIGQEEAGTFRSCLSTGDTLYVLTSEGLHTWQTGDEGLTMQISSEKFPENGLFADALLFSYDDAVGLLCPGSRTIWAYENGKFTLLLNYAKSGLGRMASVVYQDGWLFASVLEEDATRYDSQTYRMRLSSGAVQKLDIEGVLEFSHFQPGSILAIVGDKQQNQASLAVIDTDSGAWASTLYTTTLQGIEGLACDASREQIYALVKGTLARWTGEAWDEMQGFSFDSPAASYAVMENGFVSVSYDNLQYVPFAEKESLPTLTIRGYMTAGNEDADFQAINPSIAVVREREPALKAADIQKAIADGDSTDLFHVKLDSDLMALFESGTLVQLPSSEILVRDTREMLPVFQEVLFSDHQLLAVPSAATVTVWESEDAIPMTFEEGFHQQASQRFYLAHHWAQEPWRITDYADYLLTTYIAEASPKGGSLTFDTPDFRAALEALRSAPLPAFPKETAEITASAGVTMSLSGTSASPSWVLPCRIAAEAPPNLPVRLNVYVLNPHAKNPDAALRYLAYIATHREPEAEAVLKPDRAVPTLHPGVQKQIEDIVEEQHAFDAQRGVPTDEETLQMRISALTASPASWAVTAERLEAYKEQIVPCLDVRISPLLCSSAKAEGGVYSEMKATVLDSIEGRISLEACILQLDELAYSHFGAN